MRLRWARTSWHVCRTSPRGGDAGNHRRADRGDASARAFALLDCTSSREANRSVVTIAGEPAAVFEAAVRSAGVAVERIGPHRPARFLPAHGWPSTFFPLFRSREFISPSAPCSPVRPRCPVGSLSPAGYLYEAAATRPDRVALDEVRSGQFEGLRDAVLRDASRPSRRGRVPGCTHLPAPWRWVRGNR